MFRPSLSGLVKAIFRHQKWLISASSGLHFLTQCLTVSEARHAFEQHRTIHRHSR